MDLTIGLDTVLEGGAGCAPEGLDVVGKGGLDGPQRPSGRNFSRLHLHTKSCP